MKKVTQTLTLLTLLSSLVLLGTTAQQPEYDIVLEGGCVIDPETGFDAIRNVAIRGDRVVEISEGPLTGCEIVDVSGLIVSPGFIHLHAHGQTNEANEYQAHHRSGTRIGRTIPGPLARVTNR